MKCFCPLKNCIIEIKTLKSVEMKRAWHAESWNISFEVQHRENFNSREGDERTRKFC